MPEIEADKLSGILQAAKALHSQRPDWVTFYREILGLQGAVRRSLSTLEQLTCFEQTEVYGEIQRMLTDLRRGREVTSAIDEPTHVITVRIPKSLHEALRIEAHQHNTSMNKLCISKLLQFIDNQKVPTDTEVTPARENDDTLTAANAEPSTEAEEYTEAEE